MTDCVNFLPEIIASGDNGISSSVTGDGSCDTPFVINNTLNISASDGNGIVALSDGIYAATESLCMRFSLSIPGDLEISDNACTLWEPIVAGSTVTLATPTLGTAPSGSSTVIEIRSNTGAVYATGVFSPGSTTGSWSPGNTFTVATDTRIAAFVTSVGSVVPGCGFSQSVVVCEPGSTYAQSATAASEVSLIGATGTCIDTTVSGNGSNANPYIVSSAPIESPDAQNILECRPNGFYVGAQNILASNCYRVSFNHVVDDTLAVGTCSYMENIPYDAEITMNPVRVSEAPTGASIIYTIRDDTGFVWSTATIGVGQTQATFSPATFSTPSSNFFYGSVDQVGTVNPGCGLTASAIICEDGADVDVVAINVTDTNGIDLSISGNGTSAVPYDIQADPVISPDAGNVFEVRANGLYSSGTPSTSTTFVEAADNNIIDTQVTGDGSNGNPYTVSSSINLSPDANQGLEARANGLWAPQSSMPTGAMAMWPTSSAPSGFLIANGAELDRTTFADLFAIIGTTYGSGNGVSTFNIPDMRGVFPIGVDAGDSDFDSLGETGGAKEVALTASQLPAHTHSINHDHPSTTTSSHGQALYGSTETVHSHSGGLNRVAQSTRNGSGVADSQGGTASHTHTFNVPNFTGTSGSTGNGLPHDNMPPFMAINFIIKT